jgi:hypothetical protein
MECCTQSGNINKPKGENRWISFVTFFHYWRIKSGDDEKILHASLQKLRKILNLAFAEMMMRKIFLIP